MKQNFTTNDLIKNLYEPKFGYNQTLSTEERQAFASLEQVKDALNLAFVEPPTHVIDRIVAYAQHK